MALGAGLGNSSHGTTAPEHELCLQHMPQAWHMACVCACTYACCIAQTTLELQIYVVLLARALDVSEPLFMLLTLLETARTHVSDCVFMHVFYAVMAGRVREPVDDHRALRKFALLALLVGVPWGRRTRTLPQGMMVGP